VGVRGPLDFRPARPAPFSFPFVERFLRITLPPELHKSSVPLAIVFPQVTPEIHRVTWSNLYARLFLRALASPALGLAMLRVAWRFRRRGWLRHPPFLPIPSRDYMRWRMYTAYGNPDAVPPVEDVIAYARWASGPGER
jgi:hypothetical protein